MVASFLAEQFDAVAAQRRTITVYADDPPPEIASHFEDWNVELRFDRLPEGTDDGFVTVRRGEEFLGSLDLAVFDPLLEPPVSAERADTTDGPQLDTLLAMLDGTTFRSFDRRQLLAVSREFEDRAWRVGRGTLHAGFQRPGALAEQRDVYEKLADRGPDTHVYFDGAWDTDPLDGVTMHGSTDDELGRFWFVVFFSNEQHCALLAREHADGYGGFWTYDSERTALIDDHLRDRYW